MAMLEAFVHDPLINWRLLTPAINAPSDVDDDDSSVPSHGFPFESMGSGSEHKEDQADSARVSGPASIARSSRPRGADQLGTSIRGNWERELISTIGATALLPHVARLAAYRQHTQVLKGKPPPVKH